MAERAAGKHWLVLMEEPEAFPSRREKVSGVLVGCSQVSSWLAFISPLLAGGRRSHLGRIICTSWCSLHVFQNNKRVLSSGSTAIIKWIIWIPGQKGGASEKEQLGGCFLSGSCLNNKSPS